MPVITVSDFKCSNFPTILYHFFPSTDKYGERFCSILTTALTSNTWKVQVVLLAAIKLFIERLGFIFVCLYLKACFSFIAQVGYEEFSSPIFLLAYQNGLDL